MKLIEETVFLALQFMHSELDEFIVDGCIDIDEVISKGKEVLVSGNYTQILNAENKAEISSDMIMAYLNSLINQTTDIDFLADFFSNKIVSVQVPNDEPSKSFTAEIERNRQPLFLRILIGFLLSSINPADLQVPILAAQAYITLLDLDTTNSSEHQLFDENLIKRYIFLFHTLHDTSVCVSITGFTTSLRKTIQNLIKVLENDVNFNKLDNKDDLEEDETSIMYKLLFSLTTITSCIEFDSSPFVSFIHTYTPHNTLETTLYGLIHTIYNTSKKSIKSKTGKYINNQKTIKYTINNATNLILTLLDTCEAGYDITSLKLRTIQHLLSRAGEKSDQRRFLVDCASFIFAKFRDDATLSSRVFEFLQHLRYAKDTWLRVICAEMCASVLLECTELCEEFIELLLSCVNDITPSTRVAGLKGVELCLNESDSKDKLVSRISGDENKLIMRLNDEKPIVRRSATKLFHCLILSKGYEVKDKILESYLRKSSDESISVRNVINETVSLLLQKPSPSKYILKHGLSILFGHYCDTEESLIKRSLVSITNILLKPLIKNNENIWALYGSLDEDKLNLLSNIICAEENKNITKTLFNTFHNLIKQNHTQAWRVLGVVCNHQIKSTTPALTQLCVKTWLNSLDIAYIRELWISNQITDSEVSCIVLELLYNLKPRISSEDSNDIQSTLIQLLQSNLNNVDIVGSSGIVDLSILHRIISTLYKYSVGLEWANDAVRCVESNLMNPGKEDVTHYDVEKMCRNIYVIGELSLLGYDYNNPISNAESRLVKISEDLVTLFSGFLSSDVSLVSLRAFSLTTLGKLCLTDYKLAKIYSKTFMYELNNSSSDIMRNNSIYALVDLCKKNTTLISNNINDFVSSLNDPSYLVRQVAHHCITHLVQQDYVKLNHNIIVRYAINCVDPGVDYTRFFPENGENAHNLSTPSKRQRRVTFTPTNGKRVSWKKRNELSTNACYALTSLFKKKDSIIIPSFFLHIFSVLNGKTMTSRFSTGTTDKFFASAKDRQNNVMNVRDAFLEQEICSSKGKAKRLQVYNTLLSSFSEIQRLNIIQNLFQDVLEETENISDQMFEDAISILLSPDVSGLLNTTSVSRTDSQQEEESTQVIKSIAHQFLKDTYIPVSIRLYKLFQTTRSVRQKELVKFLVVLKNRCPKELEECLLTMEEGSRLQKEIDRYARKEAQVEEAISTAKSRESMMNSIKRTPGSATKFMKERIKAYTPVSLSGQAPHTSSAKLLRKVIDTRRNKSPDKGGLNLTQEFIDTELSD